MAELLNNSRDFLALKESFSVQELLCAVYDGSANPAVGAALSSLAPLGPPDIASYVERLPDFKSDQEKLIYLLVSLRSVSGELQWVHFELAGLHHNLMLMGLPTARTARFIHANLALQSGKLNEVGSAVIHEMLAETLLIASPADALDETAKAVRLGRLYQLALASQAAGSLSPPRRVALEAKYPDILKVAATKAQKERPLAGVARHHLTKATTVKFEKPQKDGDHYIFSPSVVTSPAIDVLAVKNATISVDIRRAGMTEFYVFDKNGTYIPEVSRGHVPFKLDSHVDLKGTVGLLDDWFSEMNICHFLLDKIPRLSLYRGLSKSVQPFLFRGHPYYSQVLGSICGGLEALTVDSDYFTARVETLLVSNSTAKTFCHPAQWFPEWAVKFLKSEFVPAGAQHKRKLFISRADAKNRRILNQSRIDEILAEYGYESLELTGRSFVEQKEIFASASHVIGVHGAGLTNILFSKAGLKVLEILPPMCAVPDYWQLSSALDHEYFSLIADDPDFPRPDYSSWIHNPALNMRDVWVDEGRFRERLDDME